MQIKEDRRRIRWRQKQRRELVTKATVQQPTRSWEEAQSDGAEAERPGDRHHQVLLGLEESLSKIIRVRRVKYIKRMVEQRFS